MSKVSEVMTQTLITVPSDATAAEAATIMRDHDIGNVLVVEDGKLRGIVTDRDLAMYALTRNDESQDIPVHELMSHKVTTGEANWSLERAAKVMAKHQIRRLPIVEHGRLVGILSIGDVSRYTDRKDVVKDSLEAISTPNGQLKKIQRGFPLGVVFAALAATFVAWINWSQSGQALRKQMEKSKLYHTAKQTIGTAQNKMSNARVTF